MTGLRIHRIVGSRNLRAVPRLTGPGTIKILNAFKYGLTNGPTEGFNNKIKVLKQSSYGIRNFKPYLVYSKSVKLGTIHKRCICRSVGEGNQNSAAILCSQSS
ncbi:transposase [Enterocloster aldenensis]|jgi:hypothetical protein|uniref:Transposase n=1 Tax=Enterocloster aldenensis TaxID=358742 RepID=A0AAW5BTJ3_9FIRM|nr:transposase [Enterocloster aldenensis]